LCEKSNSKSNGNGESFGELSKQKQALQRERDALIEESTRLRSDMTNAEDRINGLEKESAEGKTDWSKSSANKRAQITHSSRANYIN